MKKLRLLLSVVAVLTAIGGVFANEKFTIVPGYYWVDATPNPQCIEDGYCCSSPGTDCINDQHIPLGYSSIPTGTGQCGTLLQRVQL